MYFVLRTGITGWNTGSPAYANAVLRRLDKALKDLQASDRADIENVEIKGLIPEFDWDATQKCWQVGNSGTFAKLPRGHAVMNTCEISIPQLLAIIAEIEKVVLHNPPVDPVASKKQHRHGSTKWISEDLFAATEGLELRIKCRGRRIANGDDLRVVIAYDRFYDQHPNKDGSNPVARAAWFWQQAILLGFTTRSWHPSNFKAVRDHLTNRGCHEWESNEYQYHRGIDGKRLKPGFACKWSVNLARLEQVIEEMRSCGSAAREPTASAAGSMNAPKIRSNAPQKHGLAVACVLVEEERENLIDTNNPNYGIVPVCVQVSGSIWDAIDLNEEFFNLENYIELPVNHCELRKLNKFPAWDASIGCELEKMNC